MIKFTVHTIVKNEDQWIWFALQSVLDLAEEILVFDTGSTDNTKEIIKSINSPKIIFEEKGEVDKSELIKLRNEQIKRTKTEWFLILDGDEIWPNKQLQKLTQAADTAPDNIIATFNRTRNSLGDVYHYAPEQSGNYQIAQIRGNLNMRMIKKTPDLKVVGEYPLESYINERGPIIEQIVDLLFVDCWYLHTTFLSRSSEDLQKFSGSLGRGKIWERGLQMLESELPETLFKKQIKGDAMPLTKRPLFYEIGAAILDPIIKLKRELK